MDEFEIIRRYFARDGDDDTVRLGIGDDGAVLAPAHDRDLVCVVDTIVEGVHYPVGLSARDIGFRAVAVNLSDLAAMAARPRWMTLALTLSANDPDWLDGFARGLFEAASHWSMPLVGGDTTRGEQTVVTVELLGDVERGAFLTRSGAKSGDDLYVTGTPGDAAGGLASIVAGNTEQDAADGDHRYLRQRFTRPTPRVPFGLAIAGIATAAIDVSDGLVADAGKLAHASNTGARIDLQRLPLSAELRRVAGDAKAARYALTGGDDYELCFSADPADGAELHSLADALGVLLTRIGKLDDTGQILVCREGQPVEFSDTGYRHF